MFGRFRYLLQLASQLQSPRLSPMAAGGTATRIDQHRQFLELPGDAVVAGPAAQALRIMSYNVLSAASADSGFFSCERDLLLFHKRSKQILREITDYSPSILCLQEADNIREFYGPSLAKLNLDYVHVCRTGKADGEGVWFDRRRWFCRASQSVRFADLEEIARKEGRPNFELFSTPNVAQIAILEALQPGDSEPTLLVVSSLHLWWKPDDGWLRAAQTRYFYQQLQLFLEEQEAQNAPVILAGDFNSLPRSKVYSFMRGKGLQSAYALYPRDAQAVRAARAPKVRGGSTRSEDLTGPEAPFTSVNGARTETIDYIWFSEANFTVDRLLDVPDISKAHDGLPTLIHPSDHLPLVADLRFRPQNP